MTESPPQNSRIVVGLAVTFLIVGGALALFAFDERAMMPWNHDDEPEAEEATASAQGAARSPSDTTTGETPPERLEFDGPWTEDVPYAPQLVVRFSGEFNLHRRPTSKSSVVDDLPLQIGQKLSWDDSILYVTPTRVRATEAREGGGYTRNSGYKEFDEFEVKPGDWVYYYRGLMGLNDTCHMGVAGEVYRGECLTPWEYPEQGSNGTSEWWIHVDQRGHTGWLKVEDPDIGVKKTSQLSESGIEPSEPGVRSLEDVKYLTHGTPPRLEFGGPHFGAQQKGQPAVETRMRGPNLSKACDEADVREAFEAKFNSVDYCFNPRNVRHDLSADKVASAPSRDDEFTSELQPPRPARSLKEDDLSGGLVARWKIDGNGDAREFSVVESSLGDKEVVRCIERLVERIEFAEPRGKECEVTYSIDYFMEE